MKRTSVLTFAFGALFGCLLSVAVFASVQSKEMDPVKLSPQYYKVKIDNDRMRVVEYHLLPGQKEPMHFHRPGMVYSVTQAKLRLWTPDGKVEDGEQMPGEVTWRENTTHALENIGTTEAVDIAVELKGCPK